MSNQAKMEINFWRDLYKQLGHEGFLAQRKFDGEEMVKFLPGLGDALQNETLTILEVGSGLISALSMVEGFKAQMTSMDPIMDQYAGVVDLNDPALPKTCFYHNGSGEDMLSFGDESFDVIACINVIDHTPNPEKMLSEIKRVLKPGGRFYFEVNFDDALSPAHYAIWNAQKVEEFFGDWKPESLETDYRDEYNQTRYWAKFVK